VGGLLVWLRGAGAHEQAAVLTARLSAVGMFVLVLEQQGSADQFRFGREADGTPSAQWVGKIWTYVLCSSAGDMLQRRRAQRHAHVGRHAARQPAQGRQPRNRRDELNDTHPNRPNQFFEAQLAGGASEVTEEFN
jgi:hypothetical protein